MFAGVYARINAMSDLPFTIYSVKGDKALDDSDNYKNVVGCLPYPSRTFGLSEGGLVMAGSAYWYKGVGSITGTVKELRYWLPDSVKLDKNALSKGDILFTRTGQTKKYTPNELLYMWLLDPTVEFGPPSLFPFASALTAAQANGAITKWIADYMSRGAVKAMLLMVDGMPPPGEVDRMETWFNHLMNGAKGIVWKVFNGTGVKPTVVGDGMDSLKDLGVNESLRYDIHQALGTRHLLEDENYATAKARDRQFYTLTIVPDARTIQYSFNEQLLHKMGFHLEFEPERLEAFQEDEKEQAESFGMLFDLFSSIMSTEAAFELASQKLDYQFTDEQKALIAQGITDKKKKADEVAAQMKPQEQPEQLQPQPQPQPQANNAPPQEVVKALVELDRWKDKVTKAGRMVTWHAVYLPPDIASSIANGDLSFEDARASIIQTPQYTETTSELQSLADAINAAARGMNNTKTVEAGGSVFNISMPAISLSANMPEQNMPDVTVNIPQQPAPIVNIKAADAPVINNITVQPANVETPVNNITVQPAPVILPALPTEAKITTNKTTGERTMTIKK
jgi:hypothetical protein